MEKKDNNLVIIFLVIIVIILGTLCVLLATGTITFHSNNNENGNDSTKVDEGDKQESTFGKNDTFSQNTETGIVDVLGYVEIEEVYDDINNKKENYVFFKIIDTKSNDFLTYLKNRKGNSFVSEKAIGLGCLNNNIISYDNSSDFYGNKNYKLSLEVSNKILNSTKDKPVKLRLNKMLLTNGGEAPTCYSHITNIDLIK